MLSNELVKKLQDAKSLDDVKDIVKDNPELNSEKIWEEIERHRSAKSEKLDLNELDAVAGGSDRDWVKDGCAATCEYGSWCGSNDYCHIWDVTYDNFWATCPDGQQHVYVDGVCTRCGHKKSREHDRDPWD